jgi:3'-phosphoadenosine 5'-phosphosulfate sulfotransferase (PAPS reductase)/FAD synthetase
MRDKQTVLFGSKPIRVTNKKIIKSGSIKFYEPTSETPEAILDDLENIYHRTNFYVLTSGGKDSVALCDWMNKQGKLKAVVHIKTNIGVQKTTDFVVELCEKHDWPYHIIEPQPKFIYASFVLQYGFPGPAIHHMVMGMLKFKTMRDFALSIDRKNHCLISGVRKYESIRRLGNYAEPINSDGSLWFGSPFFYKSTEEVYRYVHENGLSVTPVHDVLGFSGECMCGSFGNFHEKKMIRSLDEKLADYIEWLEDGVKRFGTSYAKAFGVWGGSTKMSELEQQKMIDEFLIKNPELKPSSDFERIICGQECGPGTMQGMMY